MRTPFLAFFTLLSISLYSQSFTLSDSAKIYLVTLGPDQNDLVQAFGHSAVRVHDPLHRFDVAYNYGVFSFDQPNFYLNFARGHNMYYLGLASYPEFREVYIYYNRYVHEQELDLSKGQRQRVFDFLQQNAQPQNRSYLYDYFFDNCSTRIRDVLTVVLRDSIEFDGSFITKHQTIRQLTDPYLHALPWGDLGIDIGLGSPIDRPATSFEYMYLPEELEKGFDHAFIIDRSAKRPLVKQTNVVYSKHPEEPEKSVIHPWVAFGGLFAVALALSIRDFRRKLVSKWFDIILLLVVGFVGLVAFLLWTATDHHSCARNYNLLWALPTHLAAGVVLFRRSLPRWITRYFQITSVVCICLLVFWPWLPQQLNVFLIPVVGTLLIRSVTLFRLLSPAA